MKKTTFLPLLLVLPLCLIACARESLPAQSAPFPEGNPALEASSFEEEPLSPSPAFEEPEQPYWILGECAYQDGTLTVYEEEFPDEYNKQFSNDTVFHAIRWQIFDAGGVKIGEGDSKWSNGFAIHDLPITDFQAEDGLVTFSAGMPAEYSGWPFRRKFTLVIDDERLPILGENPNGVRTLTEDWYPLLEERGYRLENCSDYDWTTDRSVNRLLLTGPAGERREMVFDCDDRDFWHELMLLNQPGYVEFEGEKPVVSRMQIELLPERGTITFTIPKLTATVTLLTGETEVERHYTADMLQTELLESPDGKYAVYTAGEFWRFESVGGCDYVSVGPDGTISFLYAGSELDQIVFAGNDRILANTYDQLRCYDAATGRLADWQPQFDYGQTELRGEVRAPKYLTVGLAVDPGNERILVAYRLNTFGDWELEAQGETLNTFPVTLAVFDWSGTLLTEAQTGLSVKAFNKFTLIPVRISTDQSGVATLWIESPEQGGTVAVSYPID